MRKKIVVIFTLMLLLASLNAVHVEIGTGTMFTHFVPANMYYSYSWSRTIYLQSDLISEMEINAISYNVENTPNNLSASNQSYYMRHTTDSTISSAGYIDPATDDSFQLVFSGTVTYNGSGWHQIVLDSIFEYNGTDNLEIAVTNNSGSWVSNYPRFYGTNVGVNRSVHQQSDGSFPTGTGSLYEVYPNIRFQYVAEGEPSMATLTAPANNSTEVAPPVELTWTNGADTDWVKIYLSISRDDVVTMNQRALVADNYTQESYTADNLNAITNYYWRIVSGNNISDYLVPTNIWNFTTAAAEGSIIIGTGTEVNTNLPMEPYYGYSISQTIYNQEWLDVDNQRIEQISYHFNGHSAWTEDVQIYMAHTTLNTFETTSSWVLEDELMLVFEGQLQTTAQEGWITLPLTVPFNYNNTDNLLVAFAANTPGNVTYYDNFYGSVVEGNKSIYYRSDGINSNFISPNSGTLTNKIPNTLLTMGNVPTTAQLMVFPYSYAWDDTMMNSGSSPKTFSMRNIGLGTLTINSVSLNDDNHFILTDTNTYPLSLTTDAVQFTVTFSPTAVGDFSTNIVINDSEDGDTIIPLSGTGYDATIFEFPHFEGFEDLAYNEMPQDWTAVVSTIADYTTLGSSGSYTYQGNGALEFHNSSDLEPTLIALTPPIDDLSNRRIRFMAKGQLADPTLIIGTAVSNVGDVQFTPLETITLTEVYEQYQVGFADAAADAQFIALKYGGMEAPYISIYVDNFIIENIPTGPSITINQETLDFGDVSLNRTGMARLDIENWGIAPLEVSFSQTGAELSFVPEELTIVPNDSNHIMVSLSPIAEGAYSGSFTVSSNDPNLPAITITTVANILPALPEGVVLIGNGTLAYEGLPLNAYYRHSYSQSIYYAGEIGLFDQRLEKISWHYNGISAWGPDEIKIYVGLTDETEFLTNTSWMPVDEMIEVYDGTITVPDTNGLVEITLDMPFNYSGVQNLVIGMFHTAPFWHGQFDAFYCTYSDANRSLLFNNDYSVPDPAYPPMGELKNSFPNVKLQFSEIPSGAGIGITQNSLDFGNVYLNRTGNALLNINSQGVEALEVDFSQTGTELSFIPAELSIAPYESAQVVVQLTPEAEGAYSGSFTVNSNDPNSPEIVINTTANVLPALPEGVVIIGDGDLISDGLPLEPLWNHSYSQSIYYAYEIGMSGQRIEKISWHYNGNNAWGPDAIKIYMGLTEATQFNDTSSWIPASEMMEVYDGEITVPATDGFVEINLDIPFVYDDSQNLVVGVFKTNPSYHSYEDSFYCTSTNVARSLLYRNDYNVPNPYAPPIANSAKNAYPNVKLQFGEVPDSAELTVYPANVVYEMVAVGDSSTEKIFTMRSIGLQDVLVASAPVITGADADQFAITSDNNTYPMTLPFGVLATVGVTFSPTSEGPKSATIQITGTDSREVYSSVLSGYGYADDGNDEATSASELSLPVNGATYAIMPAGDIDWYKIPAMGLGDTLMTRVANAGGSNIGAKIWLYGPVENPANIASNSFIADGTNLEVILPANGDYYLRVAKSTNEPELRDPTHTRKNLKGQSERDVRDDTGLYSLYADARYNYDYNAPLHLTAVNQSGYVELDWVEPPYERYLIGYHVYRNGSAITETMIPIGTTTYDDADVVAGTEYNYHVIGMYEEPDGFSEPSNIATIIYFDLDAPFWSDDFEEYPDFILDLPNWIQYDVDGSSTYSISNVEFENAGEPMSYIVFNPASTVPPITDMEPQSGDKFLASLASTEGQNDDWIITPRVTLGSASVVSFYARSYTSDYGLEKFSAKMSLGGDQIEDFTFTLHQGEPHQEAPTEWTLYSYNVSALAGSTARFAIQCVSSDAFMLMIDNFRIDSTDDAVDTEDVETPPQRNALNQNYPNPFNPETSISFSMKEAGKVTLEIYNIRGQKVKTVLNEHKEAGQYSVVWNGTDDNGKSVSSGVYLYRMKNGKFNSTKKMILMK